MRVILQRARGASVSVVDDAQHDEEDEAEVLGSFDGPGLVALVGVTHGDDEQTARQLAEKTAGLRIMTDGQRPELSCAELAAPVLVISQFTLYADVRRGRRPSWSAAAPAAVSEPLVAAYAQRLRELGLEVPTGRFGADMRVSLVNDGPVTILLDSAELARPRRG